MSHFGFKTIKYPCRPRTAFRHTLTWAATLDNSDVPQLMRNASGKLLINTEQKGQAEIGTLALSAAPGGVGALLRLVQIAQSSTQIGIGIGEIKDKEYVTGTIQLGLGLLGLIPAAAVESQAIKPFNPVTFTGANSGVGKLIGTTESLTTAERGFVNEMVGGGKTVEVIPTTNAGRSADFLIDGTKYELKTMSNVANQTSDGLSKSLSSTIMDARGQSGNIIIDARGQAGMTPEIANRGIIRALVADKAAKVQNVTVITSQGSVYVPRIPK